VLTFSRQGFSLSYTGYKFYLIFLSGLFVKKKETFTYFMPEDSIMKLVVRWLTS
jgi:hypothetical protein